MIDPAVVGIMVKLSIKQVFLNTLLRMPELKQYLFDTEFAYSEINCIFFISFSNQKLVRLP